MKTKIKWFKEVLELEPGSKVFFPLARLYYEDGDLDEAQLTLVQGLERNPDHLEARFLLVEIQSALDQPEAAASEVKTITGMLSRYPSFWKVWAESAAPASKDSAMALSFLAHNFQGAPISWSQVIEKGLDALFHDDGAPRPALAPSASEDEDVCDEEANLRTRTMADLLADQGDYQGALEIYEELAAKCGSGEGAELETLIARMRAKLGDGETLDDTVADFIGELTAGQGGDEPSEPSTVEEAVAAGLPGKDQLLQTLEALAERLEARSAL